ncbi:MAG: permease [Alphaproteobacteria bacterium]|nr:MAG: permease [Alphaproteobacteria bacterium]
MSEKNQPKGWTNESTADTTHSSHMKWFVKGDVEGFFAFGLDAMLAFLLMSSLLIGYLGFSSDLVFTRILPAAAVGLIIGNSFYAYQALKLGRRENRGDVCAMPYGTSTLTLIIYVFLIMFPTQQKALAEGFDKESADILAWHTGLLACIVSGSIEFFGAFIVQYIRNVIPRVVMLVAVAGTGLAFLSMDYVMRTFANPIIGFATLTLVFIFYFGGVKAKGGIPGGLIVLVIGTGIAWFLYGMGMPSPVPGSDINTSYFGLNLPTPEVQNLLSSLPYIIEYLPLIIPFGFIFLIGSLQNIEGAAAAGDSYEPRPLLLMNGLGSLGAAFMGSPFPTSIFLGHPGYKSIGARAGYSMLNSIVWSIVAFTGTLSLFTYLIPIEAVMALIIWIGIIVCSQNFQVSERKHMPAIVFGLIPAFAAYAGLTVKHALAVASIQSGQNFFTPETEIAMIELRGFYLNGMFAIGQGYIYSSMVLAGITYYIIEQRFKVAAYWALTGAGLTIFGFTHAYKYISTDVIGLLSLPMPTWNSWATGYVIMATILWLTPYFTKPGKEHLDI